MIHLSWVLSDPHIESETCYHQGQHKYYDEKDESHCEEGAGGSGVAALIPDGRCLLVRYQLVCAQGVVVHPEVWDVDLLSIIIIEFDDQLDLGQPSYGSSITSCQVVASSCDS